MTELSRFLEGHEDHEQVTQDGLHPDRDLKSGFLEYKVDLLYNRYNTQLFWTRKERVFSVQCSVFIVQCSVSPLSEKSL